MKFLRHEHGRLLKTESHIVFWGGRSSSFENLKSSFPELNLRRIHQVHGDHIIDQTGGGSDTPKADAHLTRNPSEALVISTADCIPLMIACLDSDWIGAIHAGWRGVEARIVPKTLEALTRRQGSLLQIQIWIGPHIRLRSFEVQEDVAQRLEASAPKADPNRIRHPSINSDRVLIDLNLLVRAQLEEFGIGANRIHDIAIDTVPDNEFHSHRRDRDQAGRNLSFIARV